MRIILSAVTWMALSGAASAQNEIGSGTGFLVNDAGWVLTNAHVVEGCDEIEVERFGRADSVIVDTASDLALVRFGAAGGMEPLPLRERIARLTEEVAVLGYPLTDLLGEGVRATTGTVSSLSGVRSDPRYIQISAPIQPGNSGGPVLDADGGVIGVATATLSEEVADAPQNVNFAVTAQMAIRFLSESGVDYVLEEGSADGEFGLDRAMRSTFLLRCVGDRPEAVPSVSPPLPAETVGQMPPPPEAPAASRMIVYSGMDVLGFDYRRLDDMSAVLCELSCSDDPNCRAFTFNVDHRVCFLKSDAAALVGNDSAIGGYDVDLAGEVFDSGFTSLTGLDSPGGDYRRLRGTDYVGCLLECGVDLRCQAFAFVRASGDCWLKDWVGPLQSMPGVDFGRR